MYNVNVKEDADKWTTDSSPATRTIKPLLIIQEWK